MLLFIVMNLHTSVSVFVETGCSNCLHSMSICLYLGIMFIAAYFTWFKHVNNMSNFAAILPIVASLCYVETVLCITRFIYVLTIWE